jgi:protein SCO1/2
MGSAERTKSGVNKRQSLILFIILLLPVLIFIFFSVATHNSAIVPYFGPRQVVMKTAKGKEVPDTLYHSIPPFKFINQDGDTITEKNYNGHFYVAVFFFTTCKGTCPKMAATLAVVQEKFRNDPSVLILSHTVNPSHDSVSVLKSYAQLVHADTKKWNFVTGTKKAIYDIAVKGYLLAAEEDTTAEGGFLHSEQLILVDKDKHIRGIYDGTSLPDVNKLVEDLTLLEHAEKSKRAL